MKPYSRLIFPTLLVAASIFTPALRAQDWIHTGSNLGNARIRIAAADFKSANEDPQTPSLKATFDTTLYSDLSTAGISDMVSKSMIPQAMPGTPQDIHLQDWSAAPASAQMVAFGALSVSGGKVIVNGWLFDTANTSNSQILTRQYNETASQAMARR